MRLSDSTASGPGPSPLRRSRRSSSCGRRPRHDSSVAPSGSVSAPAVRVYFHAVIDLLAAPNPFRKKTISCRAKPELLKAKPGAVALIVVVWFDIVPRPSGWSPGTTQHVAAKPRLIALSPTRPPRAPGQCCVKPRPAWSRHAFKATTAPRPTSRKTESFEVIDPDAVPRRYLIPNAETVRAAIIKDGISSTT
jgi:hypothetical protein